MKILVFEIFEKGQILWPFSGLAPAKLKIKKKSGVGYVCIEESFNTIFNMGYGGSTASPPPMDYGSGKSAMDERVNFLLTNISLRRERYEGMVGQEGEI